MFRAAFVSLTMVCSIAFGVPVNQTPDTSQTAQTATLSVTEKEVFAVQEALFGRGYLRKKPNGVLDVQTRQALKEFQKDQGLEESGRIDQPSIEKLGLVFPLESSGKHGDRPNGILPKIGYTIKDETTAGGKAIGGAAKKVGRGAKTGAQKTGEATVAIAGKTGEVAKEAGDKSVGGAKSVGRGVHQASADVAHATVGRSDVNIHSDVRDIINADDKTRRLISEVKEGRVTLITDAKSELELGAVISQIRKVSGVRSVTVLNR